MRHSVILVCRSAAVDSRLGETVSLQQQYTPIPLTLSECEDTVKFGMLCMRIFCARFLSISSRCGFCPTAGCMDIWKYAEQKGVPGAAEQYLVIDPVGVELPLASVGGMRSPK